MAQIAQIGIQPPELSEDTVSKSVSPEVLEDFKMLFIFTEIIDFFSFHYETFFTNFPYLFHKLIVNTFTKHLMAFSISMFRYQFWRFKLLTT